MRTAARLAALATVMSAIACGGVSPSAKVDGAAGTTGAAGSGGRDECTSDLSCPPITCLVPPCDDSLCALGDDGFHHCVQRSRRPLEVCEGTANCCTSDAECAVSPRGLCVPFSSECGGPVPPPANACEYDECRDDADCPGMPPGVCSADLPRRCFYGPCRRNADCTKGPGGTCVLATRPCTQGAVFCAYATDPCKQDSDCKDTSPSGGLCLPNSDQHGTRCVRPPPPPP